jgi:hypothetical protein
MLEHIIVTVGNEDLVEFVYKRTHHWKATSMFKVARG